MTLAAGPLSARHTLIDARGQSDYWHFDTIELPAVKRIHHDL